MNTKSLIVILVLSMVAATLGFVVDTDPTAPNVTINIIEFLLLTFISFVFFSLVYLVSAFGSHQLKQYFRQRV